MCDRSHIQRPPHTAESQKFAGRHYLMPITRVSSAMCKRLRTVWLRVHKILADPVSRKKMTVVVCPTAQLPTKVELNAVNGMENCSRWPNLQEACSAACFPQIEFSADELQDFMTRQEGKKCISCGAALSPDDWYKSRLTVSQAAPGGFGVVGAWNQSRPGDGSPLCASCYNAKHI